MERQQIIEALVPWNLWDEERDVGIMRKAYQQQIRRYMETDEVITVTGVRRSGKSTILLQTLSDLIKNRTPKRNTLYVNFESPKFFTSLRRRTAGRYMGCLSLLSETGGQGISCSGRNSESEGLGTLGEK